MMEPNSASKRPPMKRSLYVALLLALSCGSALAADTPYLYKVTLVQAAPGKLLELIDLYKSRTTVLQRSGEETPLWMRHSQGDHWDLMILFPIGSYGDYYRPERIANRTQVDRTFADRFKENIAWQEDVFVYGPPIANLRKAFAEP